MPPIFAVANAIGPAVSRGSREHAATHCHKTARRRQRHRRGAVPQRVDRRDHIKDRPRASQRPPLENAAKPRAAESENNGGGEVGNSAMCRRPVRPSPPWEFEWGARDNNCAPMRGRARKRRAITRKNADECSGKHFQGPLHRGVLEPGRLGRRCDRRGRSGRTVTRPTETCQSQSI